MLHGYLRDIKEKVFVEEENLQDYQKRRKKGKGESQEREAPQGEFATKTSDVAGEEFLWMSQEWFGLPDVF